jgi:hypothetical protein
VLNGLTNSYANYQANKATDEQAQFDDERRNNLMHALAGGKPLTAEALAQIGASYDDILNLENHRNSRVPMPSPSYVPANFKPFKEGNFDGYIDESGNRIRNPFAMTEAQRNLYDPELQGKISLERNKNKIGPVVGEDDATRIMKYGEAAGFEPALDATARVESGNNPNAVSPAGARGTYQIMDETADDPGYGLKPLSPNATEEQKRLFAAEYQLNMLKAHPDWTYGHVVSAYNMGPGNVEKGRRNPDYEKKIMGGVRSPTNSKP